MKVLKLHFKAAVYWHFKAALPKLEVAYRRGNVTVVS
jgi:hypothetical protein